MLRALLACFTLCFSACSTPCDPDRICSFDGERQLCDGQSFVACGGANAGERVVCGRANLVGVCTPSGWTLQNAP